MTATGDGTLTYQWQTNEREHQQRQSLRRLHDGDAVGDEREQCGRGELSLCGDGGCGSATSSAPALTLKAATTITGQPSAQNVCAGVERDFSVTASGDGTLTYQWQTNRVNISNGSHYGGCTTATLWVTNVSSADAVNYRCVVTGGCGSATSSAAALTLKAGTTITQQPSARALAWVGTPTSA